MLGDGAIEAFKTYGGRLSRGIFDVPGSAHLRMTMIVALIYSGDRVADKYKLWAYAYMSGQGCNDQWSWLNSHSPKTIDGPTYQCEIVPLT